MVHKVIFMILAVGLAGVAGSPSAANPNTRIVVFPVVIKNVYICGAELLRAIEEYCVVHYDIRTNESDVDARAQDIINQMVGAGRAGGISTRAESGGKPPISTTALGLITGKTKHRVLVKCCHVGCTHTDMGKICH